MFSDLRAAMLNMRLLTPFPKPTNPRYTALGIRGVVNGMVRSYRENFTTRSHWAAVAMQPISSLLMWYAVTWKLGQPILPFKSSTHVEDMPIGPSKESIEAAAGPRTDFITTLEAEVSLADSMDIPVEEPVVDLPEAEVVPDPSVSSRFSDWASQFNVETVLAPTSDMSVEGLSWCTDLTLPDPTGSLEIIWLVMWMVRILLQPGGGVPTSLKDLWNAYTLSQTFWVLVGIAFYKWRVISAGSMLYLITSTVVYYLQNVWLHFKRPTPPLIERCRIPARQTLRNYGLWIT